MTAVPLRTSVHSWVYRIGTYERWVAAEGNWEGTALQAAWCGQVNLSAILTRQWCGGLSYKNLYIWFCMVICMVKPWRGLASFVREFFAKSTVQHRIARPRMCTFDTSLYKRSIFFLQSTENPHRRCITQSQWLTDVCCWMEETHSCPVTHSYAHHMYNVSININLANDFLFSVSIFYCPFYKWTTDRKNTLYL